MLDVVFVIGTGTARAQTPIYLWVQRVLCNLGQRGRIDNDYHSFMLNRSVCNIGSYWFS